MVSTSLLIAVMGIAGTILGAGIGGYVNLQTTKIQQKHQNTRTIADYYMSEKIEKLMELYTLNNEIQFHLMRFLVHSYEDPDKSVTEEKMFEYMKQITELCKLASDCGIFFDENRTESIRKYMLKLTSVFEQVYYDEDGCKVDWEKIKERENKLVYDLSFDNLGQDAEDFSQMIEEEVNGPIKQTYQMKE